MDKSSLDQLVEHIVKKSYPCLQEKPCKAKYELCENCTLAMAYKQGVQMVVDLLKEFK